MYSRHRRHSNQQKQQFYACVRRVFSYFVSLRYAFTSLRFAWEISCLLAITRSSNFHASATPFATPRITAAPAAATHILFCDCDCDCYWYWVQASLAMSHCSIVSFRLLVAFNQLKFLSLKIWTTFCFFPPFVICLVFLLFWYLILLYLQLLDSCCYGHSLGYLCQVQFMVMEIKCTYLQNNKYITT